MAETKTTAAPKTTVPPAQPAPQLPATAQRREAWENFRDELNKRADEIGSQLPSNVSRDRFTNAAIAAVKANPDILKATPRSLFAALTKAAQDGLLPDGREGIITVFNSKTGKEGNRDIYENVAQWNPMFYGIRKRARELDGIIIDAQVVYAGDEFDFELGDNPFIRHKPKARSEKVDASAGVAVYAIFRHPTEGILHREVMWKPDVFDVMNQSRAKTSLMWTVFWTEGWKKTVGRRASKSVPVSPQLERLIQRDDENFDFPKDPPRIAPPSREALPDIPDETDAPASQDASGEASEDSAATDTGQQEAEPVVPAFFLERLGTALNATTTLADLEAAWDQEDPETALKHDKAALKAAWKLRTDKAEAINLADQKSAAAEDDFNNDDSSLFPGDAPFPGDKS